MANPEYEEQKALFQWARNPAILKQYPALDLLEGSMNGVRLSIQQAQMAKAAGMLKGSHDITLPVARGSFLGLSIELKVGRNKPTEEQIWFGQRLSEEGWAVEFCWGWDAARQAIENYLNL